MRTDFRVTSLIMSVCILLSTLPVIFSATATETVPALPNRCGVIISEEGVDTNFGSKYNDLPTNTRITLSPTVDLSSVEDFEFDIYVEDANALKDAIENSPGNKTQGIGFYFSSATNSLLSLTRNQAYIDFSEQIIKDGWNHISVSKSDFALSSTLINWGSIKYVFLKFSDNITDSYSNLTSDIVKLRNICTIISLPEVPEGNTTIYSDLLKNTLGENENSLYTQISNRFVVRNLENVEILNNSHIAIDFSVSDYEKFNALIQDKDITARLTLKTEKNNNIIVEFNKIRNGTKSGWYNMIAPIGNVELEDITGFSFELVNSNQQAKLGEAYSIMLSIVNIYALDMSAPSSKTLYGDVVTDFVVDCIEFTSGTYYKSFTVGSGGEFDAIKDSSYIEFDLYIEDYEGFKKSLTKDADNKDVEVDLQLTLSNTSDLSAKTLKWSNLQNKVIYGGWNHIILPLTDAVSDGFEDSQTIKGYKLQIVGKDKENKTSYLDKIVIIDNFCATKYKTPAATDLYDKITTLSKNGSQWTMKDTFANSSIGEYKLENGADFSSAMFVEFDIYIQNYDAWIAEMQTGDVKGITMSFSSTQTTDYTKDSRSVNFLSLIKNSGWNHIQIPFGDFQKGNTSGTLEVSNITTYHIYFNGTATSPTRNLYGQLMSVANIDGTAIKVPDEYLGENEVVATLNNPAASGTYGDNYSLSLSTSVDEAVNFGDASHIEFDIYIEDYQAFVESFKTDVNGQSVAVDLKFGIGMTKTYADSNGYYEWGNIQNKIKHDGWNHVVLDVESRSRSKGVANNKNTIENIQCFKMWYGGDAYKKGDYQNRIGKDTVIVANICAANFRFPELPDNVLAQVGTNKGASLGEYFHYADDRIYQEKLSPVDFSKGTVIEFDVYIDDYEALLAAEEASANNYSGLERTRNSKLAFYLSSTPPGLWSQYTKPRNYFSAYITLSDKITHNGWNHIVVGKADFLANKQVVDWSNITAWSVAFTAGSNVHMEVNPSPNVMVAVCNIVNTGIVYNVPKDDDKESLLDKKAAYISDAEAISNDYGTWNPSTVYVNTDYKSEGVASIHLDLTYKSKAEDAVMYYLFDESADMKDLKLLKFDFFVDLPQFIQAKGNKAEIVIANSRNAKDYYKWDLNLANLKAGWNSVTFNINSAKKSGNPNLKEVKVIMIRFTELNISAEVFAEVTIGIDNLRYVSKTGSTKLKINESKDDFLFDDDIIFDDLEIPDEELTTEPEPQTKYLKVMKTLIKQDYLTTAIILGIEAVVLIAAVTVFIVVYRKKKKNV